LAAGLAGVAHLAKNLAPVFCLCDSRDIGSEAQVRSPHTSEPTIYLYDKVPGGVGLAARLFEVRSELLARCRETIRACDCRDGCPGCIGPQIEPGSKAKRAARALLESIQ
jgi:DEAD/DEAH box helicase domain-containing protein